MSDPAGDERSRLLRALALSRRFHLFLAYEESPRVADQLMRELEAELPRLRKQPVTLVRLDPYAARSSDAPLGDGELIDRVLVPLLSPPPEHLAHGVVHVVDASRARSGDAEAWGLLFARWNEKRNALQQLGGEVLVLLPEELKRMFATAAPDVWSIRSGEYAIEERPWLESMVAHVPGQVPVREALSWYRAVPPLALFGGNLVVKPWLQDIVVGADVEGIVAEPPTRSVTTDERMLARRELRAAEHALGQRRFAESQGMFLRVVGHPDVEIQVRAIIGQVVALAAQDRAAVALELLGSMTVSALSPPWRDRVLQAMAYAYWCDGQLYQVEAVKKRFWRALRRREEERSMALRCVESGRLAHATKWTRLLSAADEAEDPFQWQENHVVLADYGFVVGDFRSAVNLLMFGLPHVAQPDWSTDEIASSFRFDTMAAFVELARGGRSRAVSLLSHQRLDLERTTSPETKPRVLAFHAFASGLLQADGENAPGAAHWFTRARDHITEWGKTGLDRRSLHRASLTVDLAHAAVDPAPPDPIAVARQLVQRASTLLGPTGEDFIARVLAVQAARELARRLAGHADAEAAEATRSALTLARPLAGHGVPAWEAIVAIAEREASALPVP